MLTTRWHTSRSVDSFGSTGYRNLLKKQEKSVKGKKTWKRFTINDF